MPTASDLVQPSRADGPEDATAARRERRRRSASDLPRRVDETVPWPRRFLSDPMTWLSLALVVLYAVCLVALYAEVVPDHKVPGGTLLGLGHDVVPKAARFAAYSAIPLTLLFAWMDRFRPQGVWVWLTALGWGACVSTYVSLLLNTWTAGKLSIAGDGDPASQARAAIFVAPFVEEAAKASIVFWIAILLRYRFVSRLSGIALAGLAGVGFAFSENIIYYGRAYRFAAQTFGQADPDEVLRSIFMLRGVMTPYGHPLFTMLVGVGLAVAVRHKSKLVRVIAPLAGYLGAAFLHMTFNFTASLVQGPMLTMMWVVSLLVVLSAVVAVIRMLFGEGRLIRHRLDDYARAGWLRHEDPARVARLRTRLRTLWHALFSGPRTFWNTVVLQRAFTELAYLRDAMTRGLVDSVGHEREAELLARIAQLRPVALDAPLERTPLPAPPWGRRRGGGQTAGQWLDATPAWAPPQAVAPSVPLGQTAVTYSEVDPRWRPPS